MSIADISTRQHAIDYLEGYASARADETGDSVPTSGLVKTYMLETVPHQVETPQLDAIFLRHNAQLVQVDDTLWKVWARGFDGDGGATSRVAEPAEWIGFVEQLIPRHPVFYTNEPVGLADAWVRRLVQASPELDNVWLSGLTFQQLWGQVCELSPPHRFGRLAFEYESVFDIDADTAPGEDDGAVEGDDAESGSPHGIFEGAKANSERASTVSRFVMKDRIGSMQAALANMRSFYEPLRSITMLRYPSQESGGHDFYANGKVTNRSGSFLDHRAYVAHVLRIYKEATEQTEARAWTEVGESGDREVTRLGAPVVIRFLSPEGGTAALELPVFQEWISSTFGRKNNRFRLWGNPIWLGSGKVHVYGADRHLWQPISLELSRHHVIAMLPAGTCGNTIHRLVANIQRYLWPHVEVSIGDTTLSDVVRQAAHGAATA